MAKIKHLKNTGQRLELLQRIAVWIEENWETHYPKSEINKSAKLGASVAERRKWEYEEYKRQDQFKQELHNFAESALLKKELKRRAKYIAEIREFSDPKKEFQVKSRYVDMNIQGDIKYFNCSAAFQVRQEQRRELQKAFDRNYKQQVARMKKKDGGSKSGSKPASKSASKIRK